MISIAYQPEIAIIFKWKFERFNRECGEVVVMCRVGMCSRARGKDSADVGGRFVVVSEGGSSVE
jgi:hypothetical protein